MVDLLKDAKYIKGVGPSRIKQLNKLGIYTLEDVITYYPRSHENRGIKKNISDLVNGEEALIEAKCVSKMSEKRIRKNQDISVLVFCFFQQFPSTGNHSLGNACLAKFTLFLLFLGRQTPKTFAVENPQQTIQPSPRRRFHPAVQFVLPRCQTASMLQRSTPVAKLPRGSPAKNTAAVPPPRIFHFGTPVFG